MTEPNERDIEVTHELDDVFSEQGEHANYIAARIIAAYRKELAPKWTKEVPTVAGWYWAMTSRHCLVMLNVTTESISSGFGYIVGGPLALCDCAQWAGPLPEPEEPEE